MNTKTMRLPPRRISTTNASNNKRKEKESGLDALHHSKATKTLKLAATTQADSKTLPEPPAPSGQLLAGYLAHEFLTKGTLLGQPWDPARAEAGTTGTALTSAEEETTKWKSIGGAEPSWRAEQKLENLQRYVEVDDLLRADGAHLPGIVNPTQLARFLQL